MENTRRRRKTKVFVLPNATKGLTSTDEITGKSGGFVSRQALAGRLFTNLLAATATRVPSSELGKRAVVFAPHADDECLGCGGTILKKKQAGATVKIVNFMAQAHRFGSHPPHLISPDVLWETRVDEARNAAAVLGADEICFLKLKDPILKRSIADATEQTKEILRRERPEEVFVPYLREPSRQAAVHVLTTEVVLSALSSCPELGSVMVWEYPIWFWLHWPWVGWRRGLIPRRFVASNSLSLRFGLPAFAELRHAVDISDVLERKLSALSEHKTQMTEFVPTPEWSTLGKVLGGQFLACFSAKYEFFRRRIYQAHAKTCSHL